MKHNRVVRSRERGASQIKLILGIAIVGYAAFAAIQFLPVYVSVQNLLHDMDEVARVAASDKIYAMKVDERVRSLVVGYDIPSKDLRLNRDGESMILTLDTTKTINFIFYQYEWRIQHESKGTPL